MQMIPKTHSLHPSNEGAAVLARDPVRASARQHDFNASSLRVRTLFGNKCGLGRYPQIRLIESGIQRAHQYLCVGSEQQSVMVAGDHHRLHSPQHDAVPPVVGPAAAEDERHTLSPEKQSLSLATAEVGSAWPPGRNFP